MSEEEFPPIFYKIKEEFKFDLEEINNHYKEVVKFIEGKYPDWSYKDLKYGIEEILYLQSQIRFSEKGVEKNE